MGVFAKMFPGLFKPDPKTAAFNRKMRFNSTIRSMDQHIAKTNGILRQKLKIAVECKRTGDKAGFIAARKELAVTMRMRRSCERQLHNLQLVSLRADEAKLTEAFCSMINEMTDVMKDTISPEEVHATIANLEAATERVKATEDAVNELMDATERNMTEGIGVENGDLQMFDSTIDKMIEESDNLTEDKIAQILAGDPVKV